jgi:hypothetical protein
MPLGSGLAAQLGVGLESTYGTAVSVTRFLPLVTEGIEQEEARIESAGIVAGRRVLLSDQWDVGNIDISGPVEMDLVRQGMGGLWLQAFGAVSSASSSGATTHTFTPGDLTGKSLTVQVGRPQVGGVVTPFSYSGVKVASWEAAAEQGELVTCTFDLVAQAVTTGTALASATFPSGVRAYTYVHGYALVGGSTQLVRGWSIKGDNALDVERRNLGGRTVTEPLETGLRMFEGTLTVEWSSTADYQRYVNGTEMAIVLGLTASATESAIFTLNARYDGYPVTVDGGELLVPEVPFKCVASSTTDGSAITFAYRNAQTSAA